MTNEGMHAKAIQSLILGTWLERGREPGEGEKERGREGGRELGWSRRDSALSCV